MTRNKKIGIAALVLLLLAAFALTGIAIIRPAQSSGSYERDIIDRVRFSVENTDFVLTQEPGGTGETELVFTLSAQKTEADFYAVIHSVNLIGLNYRSMTFQAMDADQPYIPEELTLPADNGKPAELKWTVTVNFTADPAAAKDFELQIDYSSGITPATADEHILSVPMHVEFN